MKKTKFRVWDIENKRMIEYDSFDTSKLKDKGYWKTHILLQYTGLLDKNKKEVYEGDIIQNEGIPNIEVYYSEKDGAFMGRYIIVDKEIRDCHINNVISVFSTVVGNIYENPELLKRR